MAYDRQDQHTRSEMSPVEELNVAMLTVSSFLGTTAHADLKISIVVVLYGGLLATSVTQAEQLQDGILTGEVAGAAVACLLSALIVGLVGCGSHLLRGLRPRVGLPVGASRFAFSFQARLPFAVAPSLDAEEQSREAWRLAKLLAEIAEVKYRHVSRAITWLAFALAAAAALLILLVMLQPA